MSGTLGTRVVGEGTVASADLLAGRYALGEVVGRGRSPVHEARDTTLGRDVAVKRVAVAAGPGELDDARSRALREARAAARLSSPHVVAVYDVVEERDAVWLVMELVRAPSLESLVRERGPLAPGLAARIGNSVLDALAAAHAVGVVHRDVKPANVLVGPGDGLVDDGAGITVKLADFGVAALRDEGGLTLPGLVIGSPSYMAPEQAAAGEVGPAADLWALGALLYFAQEGVPPFAGSTALATATAVVHGRPRPMRSPGPLAPLIEALMVREPASRPPAAVVRAALQAVSADDEPTAVGPVTGTAGLAVLTTTPAPAPAARWVGSDTVATTAGPGTRGRRRRRRRHTVLAAAAAAALLGGLGTQILGADPSRPGPEPAEAEPTGAEPTAGVDPAALAPDAASAGVPANPAQDRDDAGAPAEVLPEPAAAATEPAAAPTGGQGNGQGSGQGQQAPATTVPSTTVPDEPEVTTPPPTEPEPPPTTVPDSGGGSGEGGDG
ncbi:MAG TPA: serine/threonine-protein kinase [Acidimicrobiales bacterium]|nr:serine/threonine-protein kinase [Acidimicrobiales bacterium]